MVALVGFLMIIMIVVLLLKGKMSPIVVLAVVPSIAALILGYSPITIADFIKEGIKTTTSNGILFIFSVIYFGVLSDTGLFDVIVNWLVKKAGNNVIAVTVATALVATIAHLDGTTATTVLITIPSLYPIYRKMNIDPKILLCLTGACMGVMNLLPWGGPTARAATVLQMDANALWHILIPIQVAGFVINIVLGVLLGMMAVKNGAGAGRGHLRISRSSPAAALLPQSASARWPLAMTMKSASPASSISSANAECLMLQTAMTGILTAALILWARWRFQPSWK